MTLEAGENQLMTLAISILRWPRRQSRPAPSVTGRSQRAIWPREIYFADVLTAGRSDEVCDVVSG
jgi:hypothetical protein